MPVPRACAAPNYMDFLLTHPALLGESAFSCCHRSSCVPACLSNTRPHWLLGENNRRSREKDRKGSRRNGGSAVASPLSQLPSPCRLCSVVFFIRLYWLGNWTRYSIIFLSVETWVYVLVPKSGFVFLLRKGPGFYCILDCLTCPEAPSRIRH